MIQRLELFKKLQLPVIKQPQRFLLKHGKNMGQIQVPKRLLQLLNISHQYKLLLKQREDMEPQQQLLL